MRRIDLEVHVPYAYEGKTGPTTTRELLALENAGVRVVVYQPTPGEYAVRDYNRGRGTVVQDLDAVIENHKQSHGTSGEAVNETFGHLDDHRWCRGEVPCHWTEVAFPDQGPTGPDTSGTSTGSGPSGIGASAT